MCKHRSAEVKPALHRARGAAATRTRCAFQGFASAFSLFLALLSKKQKLLDIPQPKGQLNVAQQNGAELIRGSTGVAQVEKSYRGGFYLPDATFPSLDGYCWLDTLT